MSLEHLKSSTDPIGKYLNIPCRRVRTQITSDNTAANASLLISAPASETSTFYAGIENVNNTVTISSTNLAQNAGHKYQFNGATAALYVDGVKWIDQPVTTATLSSGSITGPVFGSLTNIAAMTMLAGDYMRINSKMFINITCEVTAINAPNNLSAVFTCDQLQALANQPVSKYVGSGTINSSALAAVPTWSPTAYVQTEAVASKSLVFHVLLNQVNYITGAWILQVIVDC